jgi:hypothetical protein
MALAVEGRRQPFAARPIHWRTLWTVLIAVFWVAILVGIVGGYFLGWNWTGFKENGRLWDWLGLLSTPVFVSALPFIFRGPQSAGHDTGGKEAAAAGAVIEEQQQTALEAYQEYMFELLLKNNLIGSHPGSDVRDVARARTLTALRRVGGGRKREIVQFLHETGLIALTNPVVDLQGADLRDADLSRVKLMDARLSGVDLSNANLSHADLTGTNLRDANLRGADITGTNLGGTLLTDPSLARRDS